MNQIESLAHSTESVVLPLGGNALPAEFIVTIPGKEAIGQCPTCSTGIILATFDEVAKEWAVDSACDDCIDKMPLIEASTPRPVPMTNPPKPIPLIVPPPRVVSKEAYDMFQGQRCSNPKCRRFMPINADEVNRKVCGTCRAERNESAKAEGPRVCEHTGCETNLDGRHPSARFCSIHLLKKSKKKTISKTCIGCGESILNAYANTTRCETCKRIRERERDRLRHRPKSNIERAAA